MHKLLMFVLPLVVIASAPSNAYELEGDYLYKVSTIRAETGSLSLLLDWIADVKNSDYFEEAGIAVPLIMRHSQGDQWDLMVITPMASWTDYYAVDATAQREAAAKRHAEFLAEGERLIAFDEDHFAFGPDFTDFNAAYAANAFYHIEMFAAAAGKSDALYKQRQMENAYLADTGQTPNMIFRRAAGSDVDVFTIGFHRDFAAFAAPANASDDEKELAAKAAGFKDRADLSFYLRSLISSHHDTLAVKVD